MRRCSAVSCFVVASSTFTLMECRPASAHVAFTFTKIADTGTPMPNAPQMQFERFGVPALDNGRVAFQGGIGAGGQPPTGLYTWTSGTGLQTVADWNTLMPEVPPFGNPPNEYVYKFQVFADPLVSGETLTFFGAGGGGNVPSEGGMYTASVDGTVHCIADGSNIIPGSSQPFSNARFTMPAISGNTVVFGGANDAFAPTPRGGIYKGTGDGPLATVADLDTPVPGGTGNFTAPGVLSWPGMIAADGQTNAFGWGGENAAGIYRSDGASLTCVADTSTPVPGGTGNFTRFDAAQPLGNVRRGLSASGGDIAFEGDSVANGRGVYLSHGGELLKIVDKHTITPDLAPYGMGAGDLAMEYDHVVLTSGNAVALGLYTTLGGQLLRVFDTTQQFDGHSLNTIDISPQAISGNQMVIRVTDANNWWGLYIATANVSLWNTDSDGDWPVGANWLGGSPNGAGTPATLGPVISAPRTVSLQDDVTVGSLALNSDRGYTVAGSHALTLQSTGGAPARIDVLFGAHAIDAPVHALSTLAVDIQTPGAALTLTNLAPTTQDLNKTGSGALSVNAAQTTGAVTVSGGTLSSVNGFKLGGTLTIVDGAKAIVPLASPADYDPSLGHYPAGANSAASRIAALIITGSGQLDLGNSDLVIDYDVASPLDEIRALLASGFNGGGWDGPGIISSGARDTDPSIFALGYAENADVPMPYGSGAESFFGIDVDATSLLIKFTWVGDLNVDGLVDFQDLAVFNTNYDNGQSIGRYWFEGDFNYDGFIDFQDLSLFNTNYDPNKPSLPEPAALAAFSAALTLALRRRRCKD